MKKIKTLLLAGSALLTMNNCGNQEDAANSCQIGADENDRLKFTEVTSQLFTDTPALTGNNITTADINGDGYPDFAITDGTNELNGFKIVINDGGTAFYDVTALTGLADQAATFIVFADVDNDGDQDALLVVNNQQGDESEYNTNLYLNDGLGSFTITNAGQFGTGIQPNISVATTDFNHDGLVDFFMANHYAQYGNPAQAKADRLFMNEGNGRFSDVTKVVNLLLSGFSDNNFAQGLNPKPSWGASACDLNDDGYDDLLISSYGRQFNDLFLNNFATEETFTQASLSSGIAADSNSDYSDNLFYICYCSTHSAEATCANAYSIKEEYCSGMTDNWSPGFDDQPYRLGGNSSNFLCGDLDGDQDIDLVSLELRHEHIGQSSDKTEILINEGFPQKPFRRQDNVKTNLTRLHQGNDYFNEGDLAGTLADLNNDGQLEILVASSDYPDNWFHIWQDMGDQYTDVAQESGLTLPRAHGLTLVDFDLDGDLDIIAGTSLMRWTQSDVPPAPDAAYIHIYRNDTPQYHGNLRIKLVGGGDGQANRDGIGAKVTLEYYYKNIDDPTSAPSYIYQLVRQRQGAYGLTGLQHDPIMNLGLKYNRCENSRLHTTVTVRWPNSHNSAVTYTIPQVDNSSYYELYEDGHFVMKNK